MTEDQNDRCPVCLGNYRNCKILPCMHNVCEEPCLQTILIRAEGNTFRCPKCQEEFPILAGASAFSYNTNMQNISSTNTDEIPMSQLDSTLVPIQTISETVQIDMIAVLRDDRCSICFDSYINPKILPCMHNLCEVPCLQSLLNRAEGNRFRCPICREEFDIPLAGTNAFPYNSNFANISSTQTEDLVPIQRISETVQSDTIVEPTEDMCSICLDHYRNPRILPCMHNVCERPCLQTILNRAEGNTFRCPICRHDFPVPSVGISAFPYNTNLQDISSTQSEEFPISHSGRGNTLVPIQGSQRDMVAERNDRCSICLENYRNPRILPCMHTVCGRPCLQSLLNRAEDNTVRCPVCRHEFSVPSAGISAFPFNTNFRHVSSTQNEDISMSQFSRNSALVPIQSISETVQRDMAAERMNDSCSICLENYRNPKILPCMHNICERPCLQNLLNRAERNTFRCPLCREQFPVPLAGTSAFPYNTNLQHTYTTQAGDIIVPHFNRNRTLNPNQSRLETDRDTRVLSNGHQRVLPEAQQPVYPTIHFPPERHNAASKFCCCGLQRVTVADRIRLLYYIAVMVHYVGRIGIGLYSLSDATNVALYQLTQAIVDVSVILAVRRKKWTAVVLLTLFDFTWLTLGNVMLWGIDLSMASRYYTIFDWFMFMCHILFIAYPVWKHWDYIKQMCHTA